MPVVANKPVKDRVPIALSPNINSPFPRLFDLMDGFNSLENILDTLKDRDGISSEDITAFVCSEAKKKNIVWRDEWTPLYWCVNCDIPLLQERCDRCNCRSGQKIELKFPCNPRPVIPYDELMFKSAGLPWPISRPMVLNHYVKPDYPGWELILGGERIGDITYSSKNERFLFHRAPGYNPELLHSKTPGVDKESSIRDLVQANYSRLISLEKAAVEFLKLWRKKYKFAIPVVAFSGGKDSAVLAHICALSKIKAQVEQIDTGIEHIGNVGYSDRFLSRYPNLKIRRTFNGDMFWRAMEKLGPPARDFKWCRIILKNSAIYRQRRYSFLRMLKYLPSFMRPTLILIDGARRREEPARIVLKRVSKITEDPLNTILIRPTLDFTDLDIWMYIHLRKLSINPVYTEDRNQRLICLYCPGKTHCELDFLKRSNPDVWKRFEKELWNWRRILNLPEEWVSKNLWIHNKPSAYMRQLGIGPRVDMIGDRLNSCVDMGRIQSAGIVHVAYGKINQPIDLSEIWNWLSLLGEVKFLERNDLIEIRSDGNRARISNTGGISITNQNKAQLTDFKETLSLWITATLNCIGTTAVQP